MQPQAREALGCVAALGDVRRLVEDELDAAIRAARQRGVSLRDLAAVLGVSPETVRRLPRKAEERRTTTNGAATVAFTAMLLVANRALGWPEENDVVAAFGGDIND